MSSFFSVGVDASGNVFPATLTAYPAAAVSGAGANMTIAPQAATTTGASGSLIVNVAAPASGTAEAGISLTRAGSTLFSVAGYPGLAGWALVTITTGNTITGTPSGALQLVSSGSISISPNAQAAYYGFSSAGLVGSTSWSFRFGNSSVTLATSGTTTLTTTQQSTPNLTIAAVTLTGAATLDFGNVTGNFQLNIVGVNAASFASFGLSLKNGTTTTALPSTALSNGGLVIVRCDPNAIAFCA
jgi:hypothetical protein